MKASVKLMTVGKIIFESNDHEVLIKGEVHQGLMSYPTDVFINHSQLNYLITVLMKKNENLKMDDILKAEKMYNGEVLYTADFPKELNTEINIGAFTNQSLLRQIRA